MLEDVLAALGGTRGLAGIVVVTPDSAARALLCFRVVLGTRIPLPFMLTFSSDFS